MDFERDGRDPDDDETAVNLRAYFDRLGAAKIAEYDPSWTDAQLTSWDDNFKDDGTLFLPCSERDVDAGEYRRVLELARRYFAAQSPARTHP